MQYSQPLEGCQPRACSAVDRLWSLADFVWRPTCVLCRGVGARGRDLCAACERDLVANVICCRVCAQPLFRGRAGELVCGACLRVRSLVDTSFVPYRYVYPIDRLVQRLKYNGDLSIGRVLAGLFAARRSELSTMRVPDIIIPVPLASGRYRKRGFNQALELARPVAKRCRIEMRADLVERTRETQEQAALARRQRRKNVRGAFRIVKPLPAAHVAIFDDVVTTGSTVNELAKVLRRAGATTIEVWAIARAGK